MPKKSIKSGRRECFCEEKFMEKDEDEQKHSHAGIQEVKIALLG
jgi:hypothetical protein